MIAFTDISEINGAVRYPLPPTVFDRFGEGLDLYVRFMRIVRASATTNVKAKILSAIQGAAIASGQGDGDASLLLIELGLRAPRAAFPAEFLERMDGALLRRAAGAQDLSPALRDLVIHWHDIGDVMPVSAHFVSVPGPTATLVHA